MKTNLLLLAGLLIAAAPGESTATSVFADQEGFVIAKAVKLGRGNAYSVAADPEINTGQPDVELKKGECETNEECPSDEKCMGYKCVDVCTQPTGNGISYAKICGGLNCIPDPNTPHAFKCVDACYNVTCPAGQTTSLSGSSCKCIPVSCPSGQRLDNDTCVANCSGVVCKSGYKAVSNSTGCCCELEKKPCPTNCSTCNSDGTCTKCNTGYYLSNGTCVAEKSCGSNCSVCDKTTGKCTTCASGYSLINGRCNKLEQIEITPSGCSANQQDCGSTGCCPKTYSCSYYAEQERMGRAFCYKNFNSTTQMTTF